MAQRLLRRLCKSCKEPYAPAREDLPHDFPWDQLDGKPLYRPAGCRACRNAGYAGRMGVYELLVTSEKVRQLAHERVSSWDIRRAALAEGMRTLRMDAWDKTLQGQTSVEEVIRITKGDRL